MMKLPKIAILATGGTIAGKAASAEDTTGYKPGSASIADILEAVPELNKVAEVVTEQISNIGSEDMTSDIWLKLACATQKYLDDDSVSGVVITHGTDTMEETAFLLNLIIKSDKPVVLVGSMRPATAISADGPLNILNAAKLACCPQAHGKGVLVSMNDGIYSARDVTKTSPTNVATFNSPVFGAIGLVCGGNVEFYYQSTRPHTLKSEFEIEDIKNLPRVDIVYAHADQDSVIIEACLKADTKGIIYAGFGNGSIHKDAEHGLLQAVEQDVIVVRGSRTGTASVVSSQEKWTKAGFINSGSFNPQKARLLLQLALVKTNDPREIQEIFDRY